LVIIGDGSTLSKSEFYMKLMNYAESLEQYQSAWLYLTD
jgi:hypothetical protein